MNKEELIKQIEDDLTMYKSVSIDYDEEKDVVIINCRRTYPVPEKLITSKQITMIEYKLDNITHYLRSCEKKNLHKAQASAIITVALKYKDVNFRVHC